MNRTAWPEDNPGTVMATVAAVIGVLTLALLPIGAMLLALLMTAAVLIAAPVAGARAVIRWRRAAARDTRVDEVRLATVALEPAVRVEIGGVVGMCPLKHEWEPGQTFYLNGEVSGLKTPCEKAIRMVRAQRAEMVTSGEIARTAACVGPKHRIEFQIERVEA